MKTIPSPHGGLLHHQHDGAPREHDTPQGHRHFRRHEPGEGFGRESFGHGERRGRSRGNGFARGERHGRGHGFGRGRNPLAAMASDREGVREVAHAAQEIRAAIRTLAHRGTPDQLAEAQRLLEDTRRSLYLVLATEPEAPASEPESPSTGDATETATALEIG